MKRFLFFTLLCSLVTVVVYAQRKTATEDYVKLVYEEIPFSQMNGKLTYGYIYDEEGTKRLDGPYSIKCNLPSSSYGYGATSMRLNGSFTLNTAYSKGNLNGTFTSKYVLNCTASNGFRTQSETFTATATAGFANSIPNGVFKIVHSTRSYKSTLSANYKNGVLVGAFACSFLYDGRSTEYSGTLTQTGKPTGKWDIDGTQYEFINGVMLSRSSDERVNPRVVEFAKKYAAGSISEDELRAQNIVLVHHNMSLNNYVLYAFRNHSGVDLDKIKGWDFSQCQKVSYVELREIPMFTYAGIKYLVKDRLAIELGEYYDAKYIVCDPGNDDKYKFLIYNEDRQMYYARVYSGSNTHHFVTCELHSSPDAVYLTDSQYQYLDSVFTASRLKRVVPLRQAILGYRGESQNSFKDFFNNTGSRQYSEYDLESIRKELLERINNFKRYHNNYGSYLSWSNDNRRIVYIDSNTLQDADALLQQVDDAINKLRAESAIPLTKLLSQGFSSIIRDRQQLSTYLSVLETGQAPDLPIDQLISVRNYFASILSEYNTNKVENNFYAQWEYDFNQRAQRKTYVITLGSEAELSQIVENITGAINVILFNNVLSTFEFMVKKGKAESIVKDKKFGNYFTYDDQNPEWKTQALAALQPFCKLTGYDILNLTETSVTCRLMVKQGKQQLTYEVELLHTNGRLNLESFDISKAKLIE